MGQLARRSFSEVGVGQRARRSFTHPFAGFECLSQQVYPIINNRTATSVPEVLEGTEWCRGRGGMNRRGAETQRNASLLLLQLLSFSCEKKLGVRS